MTFDFESWWSEHGFEGESFEKEKCRELADAAVAAEQEAVLRGMPGPKHDCASCNVTDEERAVIVGYNQALMEMRSFIRARTP